MESYKDMRLEKRNFCLKQYIVVLPFLQLYICWRHFPANFFSICVAAYFRLHSFSVFCIGCDCCGKYRVSIRRRGKRLVTYSTPEKNATRLHQQHQRQKERSYFGKTTSLSLFFLLINSTTIVVVVFKKDGISWLDIVLLAFTLQGRIIYKCLQ
jgi:hypothetical protein